MSRSPNEWQIWQAWRRHLLGEKTAEGTGRSPGLRRMMGRAGNKSTFKEGRDDLKAYAGIRVSAKDLERVSERIGPTREVKTNNLVWNGQSGALTLSSGCATG